MCAMFSTTLQSLLDNAQTQSNDVKTGSSQSGPDEGGKCDSIGLSAACPSKVATIHSVVVAVM